MTLTEFKELRAAIVTCESQCRGLHAAQIAAAEHRERQDEEINNLKGRMSDLEEVLGMLAAMIDRATEPLSIDK